MSAFKGVYLQRVMWFMVACCGRLFLKEKCKVFVYSLCKV